MWHDSEENESRHREFRQVRWGSWRWCIDHGIMNGRASIIVGNGAANDIIAEHASLLSTARVSLRSPNERIRCIPHVHWYALHSVAVTNFSWLPGSAYCMMSWPALLGDAGGSRARQRAAHCLHIKQRSIGRRLVRTSADVDADNLQPWGITGGITSAPAAAADRSFRRVTQRWMTKSPTADGFERVAFFVTTTSILTNRSFRRVVINELMSIVANRKWSCLVTSSQNWLHLFDNQLT